VKRQNDFMKNIVILISGRGSNMEALLKARLSCEVKCVISNRTDAAGLETAKMFGVDTRVLDHKEFSDRETYDNALATLVESFKPDLVVLAGFMRILTPHFISRFEGKILNIHPSLLPSFQGLNTHRRAIEMGVKVHGCTVHVVTSELDDGPIIAQAATRVNQADTEDTLASKVLKLEHHIFPKAVEWMLTGSCRLEGEKITRDATLESEGLLFVD
jgi:phosphoribosylglycinamide formyltransferase-1